MLDWPSYLSIYLFFKTPAILSSLKIQLSVKSTETNIYELKRYFVSISVSPTILNLSRYIKRVEIFRDDFHSNGKCWFRFLISIITEMF